MSITIASRNRAATLAALLAQLTEMFAGELAAGTAEILVFDDASTDSTPAACASVASWITVMRPPRQVGLIQARRQLAQTARGTYLLQLDDDSFPLDPDALDVIREVFSARPACVFLAANLATPSQPAGAVARGTAGFAVNSFIGCGVALRASWGKRYDFYPAFLRGYGTEETCASLRALDRNAIIYLEPRLRVVHLLDPTERPVARRQGEAYVNEIATIFALFPAIAILPTVAWKTGSCLLYNARNGSLLGFPSALRWLPLQIATALGERAPIQPRTLCRFYTLRHRLRRHERAHQSTRAGSASWISTELPSSIGEYVPPGHRTR